VHWKAQTCCAQIAVPLSAHVLLDSACAHVSLTCCSAVVRFVTHCNAPLAPTLCHLSTRYVFTIDVTGQHLWRVPVVEGAYHDFGRDGRLLVADKVPM
jgi:hypothetical protein